MMEPGLQGVVNGLQGDPLTRDVLLLELLMHVLLHVEFVLPVVTQSTCVSNLQKMDQILLGIVVGLQHKVPIIDVAWLTIFVGLPVECAKLQK